VLVPVLGALTFAPHVDTGVMALMLENVGEVLDAAHEEPPPPPPADC
jgi:hypothetical protein